MAHQEPPQAGSLCLPIPSLHSYTFIRKLALRKAKSFFFFFFLVKYFICITSFKLCNGRCYCYFMDEETEGLRS